MDTAQPHTTIAITHKRSAAARAVRITVRSDGTVLVTRPRFVSLAKAMRFAQKKTAWIQEKVSQAHSRPKLSNPRLSPKELAAVKREALVLAESRLAHFNRFYGFTYKKVSIKNQKGRWGSCSARGNLNFNYRIVYLTPEQRDYVVVHELCHLQEMNHGPRFWALVAAQVPEYKVIRARIRKFSLI